MKIGRKRKTEGRGQPRRRVVPWWRARLTIVLLAGLVLSALGGGGGWLLWRDGWVGRTAGQVKWKAIAVSAEIGLSVQDILVLGRRETSRDDLLGAVRLARGAPILAFDPDAARRRVESLPWVRRATVERRLPDTVLLRIEERHPLALWQHKGRFALIDDEGEVIENGGVERFPGLLVVVGAHAPAFASRLRDVLMTQPELMVRVRAAVRVGGRRWNLRLDNGIDVRLPEDDPEQAWARLAEYERRHRILARDVRVLDLRLPDRLIVRKRQRPAPSGAVGGRQT